MSPELLADWFGGKVALPRRARGNAWAAAQHIESYKHRNTVTALMGEKAAMACTEAVEEVIDAHYEAQSERLAGHDPELEEVVARA